MKRVIISGGGTGGHLFPALAIADALRELEPSVELLFVGARGRIEMERVPKAGYRIEGLDIQGLHRRITWSTLLFTRSEEHTSELQSLMRISYAVFCLTKQTKDS